MMQQLPKIQVLAHIFLKLLKCFFKSFPQGNYLNNLYRGLLGDATYQISRLYVFWFQTRGFFLVFPIKTYVKYLTPGAEPFLAPGV